MSVIEAPESRPSAPQVEPPSRPRYLTALDKVMGRRLRGRTVFIIVSVVILLYLVGGPLFILSGTSLQHNEFGLPFSAGTKWTFQNYRIVFSSAQTYRVLGTTLIFALASLALASIIALTFAWLIERTNIP